MDIKRDKYLNDLINRMHNGMIKDKSCNWYQKMWKVLSVI